MRIFIGRPGSRHALALGLIVGALVAGACADPNEVKEDALKNGNAYVAEKKFQEASIEYLRALKADPNYGEARLRLAEARFGMQDVGNGLKEYYRAADLLPDRIDVQLRAGGYLLLQGRFEDAKTRARVIIGRDPKNVEAQLLLANALAGLKDVDAAVAEIEEAIKLDPSRAATYQNLGDFQLSHNNAAGAEAAYQKAVELDPDAVRPRLGLAAFYWVNNRPVDAERELREAVVRNPKSLPPLRAMALFLTTHGRSDEAESYLKTMAGLAQDAPSQLTLADYYMANRRMDEAVKVLEPIAAKGDSAPDAKLRLAAIQLRSGRPVEANRLVDEALTAAPKSGPAHLMKARLLIGGRRFPEALNHAKLAVDANPLSDTAHALYGSIAFEVQDMATAQKELTRALELNPNASGAQLALGLLELTRGDIEQATRFAQGASNANPDNPTLRLFVARLLLAKGQLPQAAAQLAPVAAKYPKSANVHATFGALHALQKNQSAARRSYETALSINPVHLEALSGLTTLDMLAKRPQDARARLTRALEKAPANVPLLILAAQTSAATADLADATALLKRAIAADANRLDAYGMLAQLYAHQGQLGQARAELRKVLDKQPRSVPTRTMLGIFSEMDGARDAAKVEYEAVLAIDKTAPIAANNLASILLDTDQSVDRALELAKVAKGRLPDDPHINDTLGWALYMNNRMADAIQALEDSVAKNDKNPTSLYHLGLAYQRNGNLDLSKQTLERAIALKPDLKDRPEVRAAL